MSATLTNLAARARQGDREAFADLYRGLYPILQRYARRRVQPESEVEEVVSRAVEKLVRALPRFDPERGCVEAWALTILKHLIIDHARASRPTVAISRMEEGEASFGGADSASEARERVDLLDELLETCAPSERRLLALRYGDALDHREIAELEGLSVAAVRKRISRSLAQLRARSRERAQKGAINYVV